MANKNSDLVTKNYLDVKLDEQEQQFEGKLTEFKSEFFDKIDPVLKEVTASREERTLQSDRISNHEDRIEKLEKIHPQGKQLATI